LRKMQATLASLAGGREKQLPGEGAGRGILMVLKKRESVTISSQRKKKSGRSRTENSGKRDRNKRCSGQKTGQVRNYPWREGGRGEGGKKKSMPLWGVHPKSGEVLGCLGKRNRGRGKHC